MVSYISINVNIRWNNRSFRWENGISFKLLTFFSSIDLQMASDYFWSDSQKCIGWHNIWRPALFIDNEVMPLLMRLLVFPWFLWGKSGQGCADARGMWVQGGLTSLFVPCNTNRTLGLCVNTDESHHYPACLLHVTGYATGAVCKHQGIPSFTSLFVPCNNSIQFNSIQ